MPENNKESSWQELCERASHEQDSSKLLDLVDQIDRLFAKTERKRQGKTDSPTDEKPAA